ncbi:MAG TPA: C39 family peptidase [Ktedonobacteraceae bacterium]|nr:C39 family peptidase [Ktedonobacteraceae bacterium]
MLSAAITALLLVVTLLIIASLIFSAQREYQRHKRTLGARSNGLPSHPLDKHVTAILYLQEGNVVGVEEPEPIPTFTLPSSWYSRRRTLVSLGFLLMILITLTIQSGFAGETFQTITHGLGLSVLSNNQAAINPAAHPLPLTASQRLVRIDSTARNQYYNTYQWQVWSYSSCSGIAMAEVMNAYGKHLIAADVLQEELTLGVWNVQLGLLRDQGIAQTAAYFGFNADLSHSRSVQDIVSIANKGTPVIVSVRDSYYFPNGHIFVVRGGDNQYVYIADSSPHNFQRMSYAMFTGMWQGLSAILTPRT